MKKAGGGENKSGGGERRARGPGKRAGGSAGAKPGGPPKKKAAPWLPDVLTAVPVRANKPSRYADPQAERESMRYDLSLIHISEPTRPY